MKVAEGVAQYVAWKHASGHQFERGAGNLAALSRRVGDVALEDVKTQDVLAYLDGAATGGITWSLKYQTLLRFFEFWLLRGAMQELHMPPRRAKVRQTFVPYVYSRAQLHALLKATTQNQSPIRSIERQTLRTILLVLYATGGRVGEVLALKHADLDLTAELMTIKSRGFARSREIPLGADLCEALRRYLKWRQRRNLQSPYLFATKTGGAISGRSLSGNFQRLRKIAGVVRQDGSAFQPRLEDIKYSFAVHRITSWIQNGADLNRMLPALAAYMGQAGLGSTERYLAMTPERFRKELNKLSPGRGRGCWRNNKPLMEFLATL